MGDITTSDFERIPETIPLGESAARKMADALRRYAVPTSEYVAWRTGVTSSQQIDARLAGVRFEGLDVVDADYLATRSKVKAGDVINTAKMSEEAQRHVRAAGISNPLVIVSKAIRMRQRLFGCRRRSAGGLVT